MDNTDMAKTIKDNITKVTFKTKLNKVMDVSKMTSPKFLSFFENLKIMDEVMGEKGYVLDFFRSQDMLICNVFNNDSSDENPFSLFYDYEDDRVGIVDDGLHEVGASTYENVELLFNVYTSEYIKILPYK